MTHDIRDTMKDYWLTLEQSYTLFYSNIIKCDQFFTYSDLYTVLTT